MVAFGLPELLLLATRAVFERTHERLAAQGVALRPAHGYTFQLLASTGGASGAEVAEHLGVTKQAASQLLDGLERAGFIARQPDPRNHRARLAVLTDQGWAAVRAATAVWAEVEAEAAQLLGPDRAQALRAALLQLAEAGGALTPPLRLRPVW
ncbi:winged helix-turn-helix transcriptional regulator [Planosporangium thailandense]|uniref:Winged helix-turn-helix transcriptional regulator n=1 Tax=Planosporangium thailandense TaxID=765197 RepID=A0ABX0XUH8_9ACTN|nr:MarR family winged helix-turn-helix transcriptional regulator [Planosporangium thailandense]NJC68997.1 winged helix-turn-helix transcriptional regulator [Planosporangium thailandense]